MVWQTIISSSVSFRQEAEGCDDLSYSPGSFASFSYENNSAEDKSWNLINILLSLLPSEPGQLEVLSTEAGGAHHREVRGGAADGERALPAKGQVEDLQRNAGRKVRDFLQLDVISKHYKYHKFRYDDRNDTENVCVDDQHCMYYG